MAGAIDLFSGHQSIAGTNLFKIDKSPLDQLDEGIEDVVGKQAKGSGDQFLQLFESLVEGILGVAPGTFTGLPSMVLEDVVDFFGNTMKFLGELDPLSPNFSIAAAAQTFISTILKPTNLVSLLVTDATSSAGVTGFIPLENLAMDLIAGLVGGAQQVWDAILASVGVPPGSGTQEMTDQFFTDLLSMLANPDLTSALFNPVGAVKNFITDMIHPTNLLAPLDPASLLLSPINIPGMDATKIISGVLANAQIPGLDASQIVSGQFPPWLMALIPVSSIGDTSPNLLTNPNYDEAISVLGEGVWVWDPAITHTTDGTGSVKVIANGTLRQLLSDPLIPVSLGQQLSLSHWLQWSGVGGTGNCFQISVVAYQRGLIQNDTPLQIVTGPAVNQGWMQLSGTYTVPFGVDAIRLELSVLPGATAGTIWWDEGSVTKTQRLAQSWTAGLVGDLSNLNSAVIARALQTDVISLVNSLGLGSYTSVGSALSAITARLVNLGGGGLFDAAKLGNIGGIPLLPSGAIPFLPASIINTGQFLLPQIPNLPATIINSGQFLASLIPGLDATKIISGVVGIAQVPTNLLGLSNITDLQAVVDGITNQFGGVNAAVSGSTQNLANAAMAGIFQTLTTNANLGQSMFSVTTGRSSAGSSFQVNFGQSSGPNLPSELTVTYSGLGSSTLGVANGLAHWNIVNDNDRSAIARYNVAPTLSDYQLVGGVLATLPAYNYLSGVSAAYYLFARMNAAGTSYDYAKFTTDGFFSLYCELGCVASGTKTVFVAATRIATNVQLWLAAGTPNGVRSYQVFGGTKPVVNYTEPGAASVIGAANRYWGFGGDFKKGTLFGSPPGDTLGVSAADNQPPSYQGSTFRCFRASGQIVLSAGHAVMPNNYWDGGVSRRTTDMVFDQASGTLTVNTEGTYLVNVRHAIQNLPNSQKLNAEVYVNGGLADLLGGEFADGFTGQSANGCAGVGIVYCFPGDTIRIGTYASNGSVSVLGESTGVATYFEAALLNRS